MSSGGRSNPRVSPWANSNVTPLGFISRSFAIIPTHSPKSQDFVCGLILHPYRLHLSQTPNRRYGEGLRISAPAN